MENKTKRDTALINLVSEFELSFDKGELGYMEEKVYHQLLDYYEDEYLFEKALMVVDMAIDQFKYRSEFYIIKARLLLNSGKTQDCLNVLSFVETIAPYEREIAIIKVRALAILKRFAEAQAIIEDLNCGATRTESADLLIAESFMYEHMKDYNMMYELLAKAVMLDSNNEEAMERIWISAELSRRYDDSVDLHKNIIERDPYNYQAWYNLGHGYNCTTEYEKAIEALEYSFIINPDFESGYLDCADTCVQLRDFNKALEIYTEANSRFGPNSELMVSIASCYISLNRIGIAKQWLLKAIKLDGFSDEAYFLLGECYARDQVWYNAINAYHKAISLENRREEYYLGLAKAYLAVENYNKATLNFQMATQTGPEDTLYWREYVAFLIKMGFLNEAVQVLDEAEEHTYGSDLLYCRAILAYLQKERAVCLELLDEALVENYDLHGILFEIAPELKLDKEITSMIKYYAD